MSLSARAVGRLFVSAQIILLGALVLLPGAHHWVDPPAVASGAHAAAVAGLGLVAVAALGLGSALTATPVPKTHAGLRTGGLYCFTRHPICSGALLFVVGMVVAPLLSTVIHLRPRRELGWAATKVVGVVVVSCWRTVLVVRWGIVLAVWVAAPAESEPSVSRVRAGLMVLAAGLRFMVTPWRRWTSSVRCLMG